MEGHEKNLFSAEMYAPPTFKIVPAPLQKKALYKAVTKHSLLVDARENCAIVVYRRKLIGVASGSQRNSTKRTS